jgi:hypothetical protein
MSRRSCPLQVKETSGCFSNGAKKGVYGDAHAPMHEKSVICRQASKEREPFISKRLEFNWDSHPNLRQDRNGFFAVTSLWVLPDGQSIPQPFSQRSKYLVFRASGLRKIGRVLQPIKPDALAEADHLSLGRHCGNRWI